MWVLTSRAGRGEQAGAKINATDSKGEKTITQEMRQLAYDNWETTDDHGMQIYGLAKDQNGKEYFMMKTLGVTTVPTKLLVCVETLRRLQDDEHRDQQNAIPAAIRTKLGI